MNKMNAMNMNRTSFYKRLIALGLLFYMFSSIHAQAQKPLLKEGKSWNYEYSYHGMDENGNIIHEKVPYHEWISGDTIISGKTYLKMHSTAIKYPISSLRLWREDKGRVYAYNESLEQEMLMYDFSLNKDEMVDISGVKDIKVSKVDTISVFGIKRRRIYHDFGLWVEGVGSPSLLSEPIGHLLTDGCISQMVSCYEDGECIFTSQDFNAQSVTSVSFIEIPCPTNSDGRPNAATYDLQGRRLHGQPQRRGVYIQDGRKLLK